MHMKATEQDFKRMIRDKRITTKAKAIFAYAYTLPDGYDLTVGELKEVFKEGQVSIGAALRSLEDSGYLKRFYSSKTGKFKWNWYFSVPE